MLRLNTFFVLIFSLNSFAQELGSVKDSLVDNIPSPVQENGHLEMFPAPNSFEISKNFNGYFSKSTNTAIIISLIKDITYPFLIEGMNDDFYSKNQFKYLSSQDIRTQSGFLGKLYKLSFTLEDNNFIRYIAYISDMDNTLWINVTYPKIVEPLVEKEILKSINNVNLNPSRDEE